MFVALRNIYFQKFHGSQYAPLPFGWMHYILLFFFLMEDLGKENEDILSDKVHSEARKNYMWNVNMGLEA